MIINLSVIGLIIIFIAWIIQLFSLNKRRELSKWFITTYIIGAILLVYDGYTNNLMELAILNALIVITAIVVLIKFLKPKH